MKHFKSIFGQKGIKKIYLQSIHRIMRLFLMKAVSSQNGEDGLFEKYFLKSGLQINILSNLVLEPINATH